MRYSSSVPLTSGLDGVGSQINAPAALPPGKRHAIHCRWAPAPVWTDEENLAVTGIRSSNHPDHSESLYRLQYAGSQRANNPVLTNSRCYAIKPDSFWTVTFGCSVTLRRSDINSLIHYCVFLRHLFYARLKLCISCIILTINHNLPTNTNERTANRA